MHQCHPGRKHRYAHDANCLELLSEEDRQKELEKELAEGAGRVADLEKKMNAMKVTKKKEAGEQEKKGYMSDRAVIINIFKKYYHLKCEEMMRKAANKVIKKKAAMKVMKNKAAMKVMKKKGGMKAMKVMKEKATMTCGPPPRRPPLKDSHEGHEEESDMKVTKKKAAMKVEKNLSQQDRLMWHWVDCHCKAMGKEWLKLSSFDKVMQLQSLVDLWDEEDLGSQYHDLAGMKAAMNV